MNDLTTPKGMLAYLQHTQYSASDVQLLSGGRSAFVYRATLKSPLPTGENTIVLKHFEAYGAGFRQKKIFLGRGRFEYKALVALAQSGLFDSNSAVQVPLPIHYDPDTHTIFMYDLGPLDTVFNVLANRLDGAQNPSVEYQLAADVGRAIGDFFGRFHSWSALPEQAQLRADFLNNAAPETNIAFYHSCMVQSASQLGPDTDKTRIDNVISRVQTKDLLDGDVLAMGDYFINNAMVSPNFGPDIKIRLYILDWETTRPAPAELDVGIITGTSLSFTRRYDAYPFIPAFHQAYRQYRTLDPVRIATTTGMYGFGVGTLKPWGNNQEEGFVQGIRETGFELLSLAYDDDERRIKEHHLLKHLFT